MKSQPKLPTALNALGRAQVVLAYLLNASALRKAFPDKKIVVVVDGEAERFTQVLWSSLEQLVGPPFQVTFLSEWAGQLNLRYAELRKGLAKPSSQPSPTIVIASSGDGRSGSASRQYIDLLGSDVLNAIIFTGHLPPDSFGHALLNDPVAHGVAADVDRWALRGHASGPEILAVIDALHPERVIFVHPGSLKNQMDMVHAVIARGMHALPGRNRHTIRSAVVDSKEQFTALFGPEGNEGANPLPEIIPPSARGHGNGFHPEERPLLHAA